MDNIKVGQLILQLRKEKGLTQQQLADRLNISNKAISKWECGHGAPDISLWEELSAVLGADILKLLQGELHPNRPDVGKIDKMRFYVCPVCGNILTSTGKANISCCGRKLEPEVAKLCTPEHEISISQVDIEYCISLNHDMSKEHYIYFIAYVQGNCVVLLRLYPEQSPMFHLPMVRGVGNLYLYCSKHGLQKYPFTL